MDNTPTTTQTEEMLNTRLAHTNTYPLIRTAHGTKIHEQGCGHSSRRITFLPETEGMTRGQIIEKYGRDLCRYCFWEVQHLPAEETPTPAPAATAPAAPVCPGSGTMDWEGGEPERKTYYHPGGRCGHCGEWVGTKSRYNYAIRKHKA